MGIQSTIFDFLEHNINSFKKDPPTKISNWGPNSAFSKQYLLPIFEHVKTIGSEKGILEYFENRFFFGREDYVPYAENWQFLIGEKGCKVMALDHNLSFSDFLYILNHHGKMFGGIVFLDELVYPPGMNADKFRKSLTKNDREKIAEDLKRLGRLGNNKEYAMHILEDYRMITN